MKYNSKSISEQYFDYTRLPQSVNRESLTHMLLFTA